MAGHANTGWLIGLCCIFLGLASCAAEPAPEASRGVLDCSRYEFVRSGTILLLGEWEFYWKRLLVPDDFSKNPPPVTAYLASPAVWNGQRVGGERLGGHGYATYRMMIRGIAPGFVYSLKISYMSTAYRIWLNGKEYAGNGKVGKTGDETTPSYFPRVFSFHADRDHVELVIQVANFHYKNGGIKRFIEFGLQDDVERHTMLMQWVTVAILGCLVVSGIYQFVLFFLSPSERASMWFGLFCFTMPFHFFTIGEMVIVHLFHEIDWFYVVKMHYIGSWLSALFFMRYYQAVFPEYLGYPVYTLTTWLYSLGCGLILVLPPSVYTHFAAGFQIWTTALFVVMLFQLVRLVRKKDILARFFIVGYSVGMITAINDFLFLNFVVHSGHYLVLGFFMVMLGQTIALSYRSSRAFRIAEQLSLSLEQQVAERTCALSSRNSELDSERRVTARLVRQLAQANSFKAEFLGMVSHDLKNPVVAIEMHAGLVESVLKRSRDRKALESVQAIQHCATGMFRLLNDLVDISCIESGKFNLQSSLVEYCSFIHEMAREMRPYLVRALLVLDLDCKNVTVNMDVLRIRQVLGNLVGNAAKHAGSGTRITIRVRKKGSCVWTRVEDEGPGIPADKLRKIFMKYCSFDANGEREPTGSGLGLAIVRKLVHAHGGEIRAGNRKGGGAVFSYSLPLARAGGRQGELSP